MWSRLLEPGLSLVSGQRHDARAFLQELVHEALHADERSVLWCDGEHGFNPYDFAEVNLTRGHSAEDGAQRVLVKRCMTPFQWDAVLTKHLDAKLVEVDASLVVVAPFDRLFSTDELADWEQEDMVRYAVRHLKDLTRRHRIPILMTVDMAAWWRTHPELAKITFEGVHAVWELTRPAGRFRLEGEEVLDPWLRRTLFDFENVIVAS